MNQFTIRLARPDDLEPIWDLVRRAVANMTAEGSDQWGDDYPTRDHYAGDIARGDLWAAADDQGRVAGCAYFSTDPEPDYAEVPWAVYAPALVMHRMVVNPDIQRGGVASALFQHAEDRARRQGIPVLHVDTYTKNEKMQALFLKRGFVQRGEIRQPDRALPFPVFEKFL